MAKAPKIDAKPQGITIEAWGVLKPDGTLVEKKGVPALYPKRGTAQAQASSHNNFENTYYGRLNGYKSDGDYLPVKVDISY